MATLFTYADSFRGFKCRIAAAYANKDVKVVEVNANDKSAKHVPNFVDKNKDVKLFEDVAIASYLASDELKGKTPEEKALVCQWMAYGSNELYSAVASVVFPALSLVEVHCEGQVTHAHAELKECLAFIDAHLKTRTYLASERLTLADISVACDLALAFLHVLDANARAPYVNLVRWFNTVINQENFKKVTGELTLCTKAVSFCPTKWSENKAKQQPKAAEKKEKKPEAAKPKAEPKKAEPKPAAAPAAADDEDEETSDEPKNDPFAAMPKGTFNVDEFKRTYSNTDDTKGVAMPYFFKNFDKECYSVWMCEYKYPEELKQTFMTCNLIGGMFQRIERLRKNAFGSMIVWGENNDNTIAGIWFWKGKELCFPLCPDWTTDYESYTWKQLSVDEASDRDLITQFFSWEGEYKGKKFNSGKIFK